MDVNEKRRLYDARRTRFRLLLKEYGDNQTALGEVIDLSPDYISRILSNGKHRKNLAEGLAREIEKAAGKPPRWLDEGSSSIAEPRAGYQTAWPFTFDRSRYERLNQKQKRTIDGVVEQLIAGYLGEDDARPRKRRAS